MGFFFPPPRRGVEGGVYSPTAQRFRPFCPISCSQATSSYSTLSVGPGHWKTWRGRHARIRMLLHLTRTSNHLVHQIRTAGRVTGSAVRRLRDIVRVQARHLLQLRHFLVAQDLRQLGGLFLRRRGVKLVDHSQGHRRWCHRHGTDKRVGQSPKSKLGECARVANPKGGIRAQRSQPIIISTFPLHRGQSVSVPIAQGDTTRRRDFIQRQVAWDARVSRPARRWRRWVWVSSQSESERFFLERLRIYFRKIK